MEHPEQHQDGAAPQARKVAARQRLLWVFLAVLAVPFGAFKAVEWYDAKVEQQARADYSKAEQQAQADYFAFVKAMMQAETIADPLERCLQYPDPPGAHWNAETTRAYCELRNDKTLSLPEIDQLLNEGRAAEVDRAFQGYLDVQLHEPGHPGVLDMAYTNAGFDKPSDEVRRVIDAWKQQAPDSPFALAASGLQYVAASQHDPGDEVPNELGERHVVDKREVLALARNDLDRAVAAMPSLTAAYGMMIHLGGLTGDEDYQVQAAAQGLKADPYNYSIRVQMMNQGQPQWGRLFGGLERQRQEVEADVSHNPLLGMVAQNPKVFHAYCDCKQSEILHRVKQAVDGNLSSGNLVNIAASVYDTDPRLAVEIYAEGLRFEPTEVDALQWRSQEMLKLHDAQGSIDAISSAHLRFPENSAIGTQLANIYRQAGRPREAEETYLAVIQRDPDAQLAMSQLGDLYNHEGHQPEKAAALANILIARHPENPFAYIVRACYLMDHELPGRYEAIHYFFDHFGSQPRFQKPVREMRAYLAKHPEPVSS